MDRLQVKADRKGNFSRGPKWKVAVFGRSVAILPRATPTILPSSIALKDR